MKVKSARFLNAIVFGGKSYKSLVAGKTGHQEYFVDIEWNEKLPQFLAVKGYDPIRPQNTDARWLNMDNVLDIEFDSDPLAKPAAKRKSKGRDEQANA